MPVTPQLFLRCSILPGRRFESISVTVRHSGSYTVHQERQQELRDLKDLMEKQVLR